jgi:hypothetical protein
LTREFSEIAAGARDPCPLQLGDSYENALTNAAATGFASISPRRRAFEPLLSAPSLLLVERSHPRTKRQIAA